MRAKIYLFDLPFLEQMSVNYDIIKSVEQEPFLEINLWI